MEEAPCIMFETPKNDEKNIFNKEILYNEISYTFSINKFNEDKLKFIILNKKSKDTKKYYNIFSLDDFKKMNKYFKMFDDLNELENDLINTIKENNIEIKNIIEKEILINIKVFARNNNIVTIKLKQAEINEKDKINILFQKIEELEKNNEIKDKKIVELENKISNISKIIDDKNKKILSLEKEISETKSNLNKFIEEINKKFTKLESKSDDFIYENILANSNIFQNKDDIQLLLNNISNIPKNLKLLYNSKIEGENVEKLIDTYTDRNDLIILVKTDNSKRFGGYAHECFKKNNFSKSDKKAFLFNLDKKKIYRSRGDTFTIWRGGNTQDSINFGAGTDLKIYHKFLSSSNKTFQIDFRDYDYDNETYALNGKEDFNIAFLEIYQAS